MSSDQQLPVDRNYENESRTQGPNGETGTEKDQEHAGQPEVRGEESPSPLAAVFMLLNAVMGSSVSCPLRMFILPTRPQLWDLACPQAAYQRWVPALGWRRLGLTICSTPTRGQCPCLQMSWQGK